MTLEIATYWATKPKDSRDNEIGARELEKVNALLEKDYNDKRSFTFLREKRYLIDGGLIQSGNPIIIEHETPIGLKNLIYKLELPYTNKITNDKKEHVAI